MISKPKLFLYGFNKQSFWQIYDGQISPAHFQLKLTQRITTGSSQINHSFKFTIHYSAQFTKETPNYCTIENFRYFCCRESLFFHASHSNRLKANFFVMLDSFEKTWHFHNSRQQFLERMHFQIPLTR